jgi:Uma2 family endonuclease
MAQRTPLLPRTADDFLHAYERDGPFPISETDYLWLALEDPSIKWELHDGLLVEKPGMSFQHGDTGFELAFAIRQQVDPKQYRLRNNHGRMRATSKNFFIPDVMVIPTAILGPEIYSPDVLEAYDSPLPFVAESLSRTTSRYDVMVKLPIYRARGDREIWLIDPFKPMVQIWRRREDGTYDEQTLTGGRIELHALPGVVIDLDALFDS